MAGVGQEKCGKVCGAKVSCSLQAGAVTGRGQGRGAESSVDRTGAIARVQDLVVSVREEKRRKARQPVRRSQADISLPSSFSRQNCVEESEGCERDIKAQAPGVVPHTQPGELEAD